MTNKLLSIFWLFFFLIACSGSVEKQDYKLDSTTIKSDSNKIIENLFLDYQTNKTSTKISNSNIEHLLDVNSCKMKIDVWQFHHYEPSNKKFLGIWPTTFRLNNHEKLKDLKNKWGISYIFFQSHLKNDFFKKLLEYGFKKKQIMIHLNYNYQKYNGDWFEKYKDVYAFYIDEPYAVQPNYTLSEFKKISQRIKSLNNNLLITGDFKPSGCLDDFVQFADNVMFTSYHRTYQLLGCIFAHWPKNVDQSGSWDVMKERYKNKFQSTWIAAHQDTLEYFQLFKKSDELNLETVWLYQLQDTTDKLNDFNLASFCEAAWQNGYLKKVSEKIRYEFECKKKDNPCNCDKNKRDQWSLKRTNHLNEFMTK